MGVSTLIGCWLLEDCTLIFSDGRPSKTPFQKGMICYTHSGYMQATLSVFPRSNPSISGLERGHKLTEQEKAQAFDEYMSYGGRYSYNSTEVFHNIDFALNPSIIGTQLKRNYICTEEQLVLSYTHIVRPSLSIQYNLKWKKQQKI